MKILKILLYLALGLAALVLILGLFAKRDYVIERSVDIKAGKSLIAEQVGCFKNFEKWSPWQGLDPNQKTSVSEKDCAVGSFYTWAGNDAVGEGKLTITNQTPDEIDLELKFVTPWESKAESYFKFAENTDVTHTTWGVKMSMPFPWNAFAMFTDVDKAIGADYEKGLIKLKAHCEELAAHKKYNGYEVVEMDFPKRFYTGIRQVVAIPQLGIFFQKNMPHAGDAAFKAGAKMAGAPAGLFWSYDEKAQKSDVATAFPITGQEGLGKRIPVWELGGRKALTINYFGPYEKTGNAHMAMDEYMKEMRLQSVPPVIEEYLTDPGNEPDTAKWLTRVVYFAEPIVEKQQ